MNYSKFWARLLGLYTVILALGAYINLESYMGWMAEIAKNPYYFMVMGMFTLVLGLAIVVTHQVWRGWPILVTILGYWISIKGILLLFFPTLVQQMIPFWQGQNMYFAPLPALIIGLILLYCGFVLERK